MNEKAERFLDTLNRSPNTVRAYRHALSYFFSVAGGAMTDSAYELFLESLRDHSPSTQMVYRSAVMGLFSFWSVGEVAVRDKLNKHYLKAKRTKDVIFDRDGIEAVLGYCDRLRGDFFELRDRAFILMLAGSGLRISELCGLNRGDVDWADERAIVVGKREKSAVVRFSSRSLRALREYLQARSKMDGDSGKPLVSLPLFVQHGNIKRVKRITSDGMRKSVKLRIQEAGVDPKNIRIHDFRHYFVTTVVQATGGNLKLAKELARHENISTTQRYAHYAQSELDHSYDEIFNEGRDAED